MGRPITQEDIDMISQMKNFKKSFISSIIVLFGFIILLKICNPIFHYL